MKHSHGEPRKPAPRRTGCRRPRPHAWQALGRIDGGYHTGMWKRRRACHIDTATSLRSEDGVWQAFRRDAAAANERRRPYRAVPSATRALGLVFQKRPVWQPVLHGMACERTRRECERVAVVVAAGRREAARLPHWGSGKRRRAWQPAPQQACAVRMAGDTPSAVTPPRNARR